MALEEERECLQEKDKRIMCIGDAELLLSDHLCNPK